MRFLKIAIIRSSFHRGSGQAVHITEIAKRLLQLGHKVVVGSREIELRAKELSMYEFDFVGKNVPFLRNFVFPFKILSFLKGFDIIHTQYHPGVFVGNIANKFHGKPHVFTYHGFAPIRFWRNPKQRLKMIDHRVGTFFALHLDVNRIIAVSHFLRNELIRGYKVDGNLIDVIYNGIDVERFNPNIGGDAIRQRYRLDDNPIVLYLGRLAPYKGVQFLMQAVPLVLQEVPNAKFLITGSMRYDMLNLSQMVKQLHIEESVLFLGFIPDKFVPNLYACCDVFCYPSLWEGFGLTPGEAGACGKPVVAFNTCAIPEVVKDGHTGLLVEPRNSIQLAHALLTLLKDENLRRKMGHQARRRVLSLFSWDKTVNQLLKLYEEIL